MTTDRCQLLCLDLPHAEALRRARLSADAATRGAELARALADPTRLTIAAALRAGRELCVCDLGWVTERSSNLVSHHLRLLRAAGIVRSRRDGKLVLYRLTGDAERLLATVLGPALDVEVEAAR
jgi:DNA-binding transcriptional ArsR family regulator